MVATSVTAEKKRNGMVVATMAILVIIIIVLLVIVFKDSSDDQPNVAPLPTPSVSTSPATGPSAAISPSPSPSETHTVTVTAAPADPPPPSGPTFAGFSAPSSVACASVDDFQQVTITWIGSGAVSAWVGVATSNAKAEPFESVETSGSATLPFPCGNESQKYTVTLEDGEGALKHRSVTITRSM